jgi:hypothetical protein
MWHHDDDADQDVVVDLVHDPLISGPHRRSLDLSLLLSFFAAGGRGLSATSALTLPRWSRPRWSSLPSSRIAARRNWTR